MSFNNLVADIVGNNHNSFLNNDLSILHFFSEWEMDCLMILPIFEGLAEEFAGRATFGKVNIEEAEDLAKRHKVSKVPSVLFFKKGALIDRIDKLNCEEVLRDKLMCLI